LGVDEALGADEGLGVDEDTGVDEDSGAGEDGDVTEGSGAAVMRPAVSEGVAEGEAPAGGDADGEVVAGDTALGDGGGTSWVGLGDSEGSTNTEEDSAQEHSRERARVKLSRTEIGFLFICGHSYK